MKHLYSRSPELARGSDEPRLLVPLSPEFPLGVKQPVLGSRLTGTLLTGAVVRPESAKWWTNLIKGGGVILKEHLQDIVKP